MKILKLRCLLVIGKRNARFVIHVIMANTKMPKYDFICDECDSNLEVDLLINDDHTTLCGRCQVPMRKIIGATPAHFKGTGWGSSK